MVLQCLCDGQSQSNGRLGGRAKCTGEMDDSLRSGFITHLMLELDGSARAWFDLFGRAIH